MTSTKQRGMVQTVLGTIDPDEAGTTLMHEHLLFDTSVSGYYFIEPDDPTMRRLSRAPVSLENLWFVRYNFKDNLDNLVQQDARVSVPEATRFAQAGGRTLVDMTTRGIARDPEGLSFIATETGLNIVMGAGYYVEASYPPEARVHERSVDEITEEFLSDITQGVGDSNIRAGIIGELGCSWPLTASERKVLRASAQAQDATGAAINVHPGRNNSAPLEIRDELQGAGADLSRVIISHMDRCGYELSVRRDLLDAGCIVEYDLFGLEGYYPARSALSDGKLPDLPNDIGRVKEIKELINLGYESQIVISHDISMKMQLTKWGGWGYGHILRNVIPLMELYGISTDSIDEMLIETPKRLLTLG